MEALLVLEGEQAARTRKSPTCLELLSGLRPRLSLPASCHQLLRDNDGLPFSNLSWRTLSFAFLACTYSHTKDKHDEALFGCMHGSIEATQ